MFGSIFHADNDLGNKGSWLDFRTNRYWNIDSIWSTWDNKFTCLGRDNNSTRNLKCSRWIQSVGTNKLQNKPRRVLILRSTSALNRSQLQRNILIVHSSKILKISRSRNQLQSGLSCRWRKSYCRRCVQTPSKLIKHCRPN